MLSRATLSALHPIRPYQCVTTVCTDLFRTGDCTLFTLSHRVERTRTSFTTPTRYIYMYSSCSSGAVSYGARRHGSRNIDTCGTETSVITRKHFISDAQSPSVTELNITLALYCLRCTPSDPTTTTAVLTIPGDRTLCCQIPFYASTSFTKRPGTSSVSLVRISHTARGSIKSPKIDARGKKHAIVGKPSDFERRMARRTVFKISF